MEINTSISGSRSEKMILALFQIFIICVNVIGLDASLYVVANASILVFSFAVILLVFSNDGKVKVGRSFLLPILVFAYSAFSILWASSSETSTSQVRTQIMLLLLCLIIYVACRKYPRICDSYLKAIYISGYLMIVYSFAVYGGINGFITSLNSNGRMGGVINGENGFGLLFAEGCITAFYFLLFKQSKSALLGIVLFPVFAFTSGSKKAVLFILIGMSILLIFKYGLKRLYKGLIAMWIIIGFGYYIINLPAFSVLNYRIEAFFGGTSVSDTLRERMIRRGLELFTHGNTFFGYGIDNYRIISGFNLYSHNNYIEALVGLGLVGTLLYYGMYVAGVRGTIKVLNANDEYKCFLVLLVLDLIMEYGMVTMYSKEIWILLGIALAIADGAINNRIEKSGYKN